MDFFAGRTKPKFLFQFIIVAIILVLAGSCNADVKPVPSNTSETSEKINISYNKNSETATGTVKGVSVKKSESVTIAENTFVNEGYEFTGWNTKQNGTGTSYRENQEIILKGNLTLYAQWGKILTVRFIDNIPEEQATEGQASEEDATTQDDSVEIYTGLYNSNFKLAANHFERTGYKFLEWNTLADGTGTGYNENQEIILTEDLTLYAKWGKILTVRFIDNIPKEQSPEEPASTPDDSMEIFTGPVNSIFKLAANHFERIGYYFLEWNTLADGKGIGYSENQKIVLKEDLTLYAQWKEKNVRITFKNNAVNNYQNVPYNSVVEEPPAPEKSGFVFAGWYYTTKDDDGNDVENRFDFTTPVKENLILSAKWANAQVTVSFDSDGGSEVPAQLLAYSNLAKRPQTDPVKEGFTFAGWYKNDSAFNFATTRVKEDITLKAKWNPAYINVIFDSAGGTFVKPQRIGYGKKVLEPEAPEKAGYTFKGWKSNNQIFDFNTALTSSITVTADWEINNYQVTFNTNGGNQITAQTISYGNKVTVPAVPVKEGYFFDNWYVSEACTSLYNFDNIVTKDITLYANWGQKRYTVTFDTAGGNVIANQNVIHGAYVTQPSAPQKKGYTFKGWKVNNAAFDFNTPVTQAFTITADWEINNYEVNFISEGNVISTLHVDYGNKITAPADVAKEHHYLLGWYTSEDYLDNFDLANDVITGPLTLYAKWKIENFKVSFVIDGNVVSSQRVDYNTRIAMPATPIHEQKLFGNWYSGDTVFNFKTPITQDTVITAHWKTIPSTHAVVTFKDEDGNILYQNYYQKGTIHEPEKGTPGTQPGAYTFAFINSRQNYSYYWYKNNTRFDFATDTITGFTVLQQKWVLNTVLIEVTLQELNESSSANTIALSYDSASKTFTAESGYNNYIWRIDGVAQNNSTNTFDITDYISQASTEVGLHNLTVIASKQGRIYSCSATITVQK